MTYYMLFDWEKKDVDFISQKIGIPLEMRYSKNGRCRFRCWLKACWSILKESKKDDCIICWFDLQGVMLYWLSLLTFRRRYICCVNIMLKDKMTFRNRLAVFCYRVALASKRVRASVTSNDYGAWLRKRLNIDVRFYLVRDVYRENYTLDLNVDEKNQVFVGGVNGRDWKFVFELAKHMQETHFCVIVNHRVFLRYQNQISSNVELLEEVPLSLFEKKMCESKLVCLPLNTEAPSGLIVMFRAAANEKMVLITKTASSTAYIDDNKGCCLKNDLDVWKNSIYYYLKCFEERKEKARNLHLFLKNDCNEDAFVNALKNMLFKDDDAR